MNEKIIVNLFNYEIDIYIFNLLFVEIYVCCDNKDKIIYNCLKICFYCMNKVFSEYNLKFNFFNDKNLDIVFYKI